MTAAESGEILVNNSFRRRCGLSITIPFMESARHRTNLLRIGRLMRFSEIVVPTAVIATILFLSRPEGDDWVPEEAVSRVIHTQQYPADDCDRLSLPGGDTTHPSLSPAGGIGGLMFGSPFSYGIPGAEKRQECQSLLPQAAFEFAPSKSALARSDDFSTQARQMLN